MECNAKDNLPYIVYINVNIHVFGSFHQVGASFVIGVPCYVHIPTDVTKLAQPGGMTQECAFTIRIMNGTVHLPT